MSCAPQLTDPLPNVTSRVQGPGAEALARAYLEYMSGYWRGDDGASTFGERLAAFCGTGLPSEPMRDADAFSPHGAGGHGIRWYECDDEICGYIPGCATGYRIPATCVAELARTVGIGAGQSAPEAADTAPARRKDEAATPGLADRLTLVHVLADHPTAMGAVA